MPSEVLVLLEENFPRSWDFLSNTEMNEPGFSLKIELPSQIMTIYAF